MAEIATDISVKLKGTTSFTGLLGSGQGRGLFRQVSNSIVTIAAAAAANDTIYLGDLMQGEYIDPHQSYVAAEDIDADNTGNYVFNIGFVSKNGAASALNEAGTAVNNDVDLFAEDLTIPGPGIKTFGEATNYTAYHVTPVRFREPVEIWATLVSETTPDADKKIRFCVVAQA